ncbi:MAG: hypothetical protein NZ555_16820 [Geminicoccaceae bacterium]|nr:hypothetical protein [Geminicoccaceae bacterium]MDW8124536.1 hypothetical protein [Geminicoccaceae bacterium]MDW8342820.1 hypothetical protein [Geminicoccaceae bacterium]
MSGPILAPGRRVAIHPGFVKTATSTLQRHVFPHHPEIAFLGLPAPSAELEWAIRHLCQGDSTCYKAERVRTIFREAATAAPPERLLLVSYENFALHESKDRGLVADRLADLFPGATILFTIRRQEELVVSWYLTKLRVLIKRKAWIPFEEWYWTERREPHRSILDDLRYAVTIEAYCARFGRERVRVVPFELLRREPAAFAEACARALGIAAEPFGRLMAGKRENAAMSQAYYDFWRRFGHLLPRRLVRKWARRMPMHEGPPARIPVPDAIRLDIGRLVAEDNRRLAELFGLDLAGLGYTLAFPGGSTGAETP